MSEGEAMERTDTERLDWLISRIRDFGCSHVVREAELTLELSECEHAVFLGGHWDDFRKVIDAAMDATKLTRP